MAKEKIRKIYRSKKEKILGGVCGGIAAYLGTDPTIIRLAWVVLSLVSLGAGILGYLLFWIIIPEKD